MIFSEYLVIQIQIKHDNQKLYKTPKKLFFQSKTLMKPKIKYLNIKNICAIPKIK